MKNRKICIVGYGAHVKNTIIPTLNVNPENIRIITSKSIKGFQTFSNIKLALKELSKDYIFFNSTPPNVHYITSKLILSSGFNLIVEKPLCMNIRQLQKLRDISKKKQLFVFENMMYFYSKQFKYLKKLLNLKKIQQIDINFSIPKFKKNTFRDNCNLESTIIYDMGCYPFSLLAFFGFNFQNYKILYKTINKKINFIEIKFVSKKINFKIILACFKDYKNFVRVKLKDKSIYHLNHFFYGKKINKLNYIYKTKNKIKRFKIPEENLFKNVLNYSNKKLLNLSLNQFFIIKKYLLDLSKIKKKLNYSSD